MRRLMFDPKINDYTWQDFIPCQTKDFGSSSVQKKKYVADKVRINNQEVSTGKSRTALYTMPGGIDNGVRYSSLYEHSGLDITEINAVKQSLANAKEKVTEAIKKEMSKQLENLPKANTNDKSSETKSE